MILLDSGGDRPPSRPLEVAPVGDDQPRHLAGVLEGADDEAAG
jgi:hypothetical protein